MPSVTVPFLVGGFGIFMMRQYAEQAVPNELIEAARVDGCSTWRVYWHVVVPALRPAAAVLGLLTFMATWNDFQWPLITLAGTDYPTSMVAVSDLASGNYVIYRRVLAGALVATIPLLVMLFIGGRQIVRGIMEGATVIQLLAKREDPVTRRQTLHEGWALRAVPGPQVPPEVAGRSVPATVPGCVHTDLLAAGLIEDPYLDDNENRLTWIGRSDWDYETVFTWHPDSHDRADLVCEGLDTVATVELNGVGVAEVANQHRSYRFAVRELLREGENTLRVRFASPQVYAEARRVELGHRPGAYPAPYKFIRKTACNFGWDWGPAVVTSGIWRPIGLHAWSGARLASVRPLVSGDGNVEVHVTVERAADVTGDRDGLGRGRRVRGTAGRRRVRGGPGAAGGEPPAVVAARVRGAGPPRAGRAPRGGDVDGRGSASATSASTPHRARDVHRRRQRRAGLRARRQLDPRRLLPRQGHPRAPGRALRPGGRGERQPAAGLGRRPVRERGLLRRWPTSWACSSGRTSRSPAPPTPRRSRSRARWRPRRARTSPGCPGAPRWCCGAATTRTSRATPTGAGSRSWRGEPGARASTRAAAPDRGRARPDPSLLAGQPVLRCPGPARPTTPRTAPSTSGTSGTARTTPATATTLPRFVAEFGFQGPPAYATLRGAVSDEPLAPDSPGMLHHQKADRRQPEAAARARRPPARRPPTSTTGTT